MGKRRSIRFRCGLRSLILGAVLALGLGGPARSADRIEAEVRVVPDLLYRGQQFQFDIRIRIRDVRLGNQINIGGLFEDDRVIQVRPFRERAPEKRMDGLVRLETRRFVGVARIDHEGVFQFNPVLHLQKIERRRTRMGERWIERPVTVAAPPLSIRILALPPDAPPGFSGAVGRFTLEAEPSSTEVAVGDLVRLRVRIEGEGARETMLKPRIQASDALAFSVYAPAVVSDDATSLVTEQILVPRSQQADQIPPLEFIYFDPVRGRYVTEKRGPFPLVFRERPASEPDELFRPAAEPEPSEEAPVAPRRDRTLLGRIAARGRVGWYRMRGWEDVETDRLVSARLAPASTALVTFMIPAETKVTLLESHEGWVKVDHRGNRGWIPREGVKERVTPRGLP